MQIENLNDTEIIMEYNGEKYKITPSGSNGFARIYSYVFEYELINTTLDELKFDDKTYLRLKEDIFILYDKENNSFDVISLKCSKFNDFENVIGKQYRIKEKNDKFEYHIKYYQASLPLGNNFTKNGLIIDKENVFKVFKGLDNNTLLKLKNIFVEKDHKFIMDVYKNKDFDRKYKIFYENECIEIQEEESKEESKEPPKKKSEKESKKEIKKKTKPAIAKINRKAPDDDDETSSDFSDNSVDESED